MLIPPNDINPLTIIVLMVGVKFRVLTSKQPRVSSIIPLNTLIIVLGLKFGANLPQTSKIG